MLYIIDGKTGPSIYGIEKAQLARFPLLDKFNIDYKFVYFWEPPSTKNVYEMYEEMGFPLDKVELIYHSFSDIKDKRTSYTVENFFKDYNLPIDFNNLIFDSNKKAVLNLTPFIELHFFLNAFGKLFKVEIYENGLIKNRLMFASKLLSEEIFLRDENKKISLYNYSLKNSNGEEAYSYIINENGERTYYINGKELTSEKDFFLYYFEHNNLSKRDSILLERPHPEFYFLFNRETRKNSKLGLYIHSNYYSERLSYRGTPKSIFYILAHSEHFDFLISTAGGQIEDLKEKIHKNCKLFYLPVAKVEKISQKSYSNSKKEMNILVVSRFTEEKCIDYAIKILHLLKKENLNVRLNIAGDGDLKKEIQSLATDLDVLDSVNFLGFKSDLTEIYKNSDVYLSVSKTEAFGTSIVEAMGFGLPIIGRDVPIANQYYIENKINGFLSNEYDEKEKTIKELAEKVKTFYFLPNHQKNKMSMNSNLRVEEFSPENIELSWKPFLSFLDFEKLI